MRQARQGITRIHRDVGRAAEHRPQDRYFQIDGAFDAHADQFALLEERQQNSARAAVLPSRLLATARKRRRKALKHGHEASVFAPRLLRIDDVVVEVLDPIAGCYGVELAAGRVNDDRAELSDFA